MADVFLSYKRDERPAVEKIAATLRSAGISTWFDTSLSAGEAFSDQIDQQISAASAVLVCWSPDALKSRWVKVEALSAFESDKLAACQISGEITLSLPTPFNSVHAEDIRAWLTAPNSADRSWKNVLGRIGKLCNRPDIERWSETEVDTAASELREWISTYGNSPLLVVVDAQLKAREEVEAIEAEERRLAVARRTQNEAIEVSLKRLAEQQRLEADAAAKAKLERDERRSRSVASLLLGTVAAIPIFFAVYVVVAATAYLGVMLMQWLNVDRMGGGITRMAEVFGAAFSSYYGVKVGRNAIGAVLKSWSGWPTFLLFVTGWGSGLFFLVTRTDLSNTWWLLVIAIAHAALASVLAYLWVARKGDPE